jgi:hypothetical protein
MLGLSPHSYALFECKTSIFEPNSKALHPPTVGFEETIQPFQPRPLASAVASSASLAQRSFFS